MFIESRLVGKSRLAKHEDIHNVYALILAGGKGERLRPLTDNLPKPMVPLCGKPILEHQVEWLKEGGVTDVVFLSGYCAQAIEDHFGDGKAFGINAHYSVEDSPLGRGGAIKMGFPKVPESEETVAVLNGDTVTDETLDNLKARYRERKAENDSHLATIMVVPMVSPYGLVDIDESDTITGFREKVEMEHWLNAGIYIFDRAIYNEFPDLGDHETETFPRLAEAGQLAAVRSRNFWHSVDSFKDLREAEEHVNSR
ncbi:MAG TPA: nucleotidyltransferase [Dehalococcoidia bacterium]|nr:nucleotidyltransferase family protein [SAR202 cluster bacterium]HAA96175.1 nucleotidyltransferase [Dehalococcoidia bacterium]